jgi:hypothetical protein
VILYATDDIRLEWLDPAIVRVHPHCRIDGERVQAYRHELRETPGDSLQPLFVVDGVCHDGNHKLMAYRCEGYRRVLMVVVRRGLRGEGEPELVRVVGFEMPKAEED